MLSALLQTIANLGFDVSVINRAFNEIFHAISSGHTELLGGLKSLFGGAFSLFPGGTDGWSSVAAALLNSVIDLLANAGSSSILRTITGA